MAARVPRYLHLPVQIMWFDIEDVILIILCYSLWLILGNWMTLPFVVLVPYWFIAIKEGMPRGFIAHLLYEYGFLKMDVYPSPHVTEFVE
jgi:hypothetical protein